MRTKSGVLDSFKLYYEDMQINYHYYHLASGIERINFLDISIRIRKVVRRLIDLFIVKLKQLIKLIKKLIKDYMNERRLISQINDLYDPYFFLRAEKNKYL